MASETSEGRLQLRKGVDLEKQGNHWEKDFWKVAEWRRRLEAKEKISSGDKKWKSLEKICFCYRLLLFTYDRSWISLLSFTYRNVKMGLTIFGSVKTTMARTFHKAESLKYPSTDPQLEFSEMEKG